MGSTALKLLLAWLPFFVLWTLFVLGYAEADLGVAIRGSAVTIGTAALLGTLVWRATARFPWPDRVRPGFYALHAALGTGYSAAWFLSGAIVSSVLFRETLDLAFWTWDDIGWRFLMGLWLYGLVAGVSYALRIRRRLQEQERAAARLEALATQARLRSLQARLNPHFLFNALNSVSALIRDEPAAAEDAVERLADLLRYSLSESDGPVTLDEEWRFTRDYLDMEGLRLGSRLRVESDLEPGALGCRLPPFALQTLVENAIRHGVSPLESGGRVRVEATVDAGALRLVVEDDGAGAESHDLVSSNGTGLRNLRERLAGTYGESAALSVATRPGQGCRAELRVPRDPFAAPPAGPGKPGTAAVV